MLITRHEPYIRNIKITFGIKRFTTLINYELGLYYNDFGLKEN